MTRIACDFLAHVRFMIEGHLTWSYELTPAEDEQGDAADQQQRDESPLSSLSSQNVTSTLTVNRWYSVAESFSNW